MSCWLCGHEEEARHHLGCARVDYPDLERWQAFEAGLIGPSNDIKEIEPDRVEILREGSMETVPVSNTCEFGSCDNPKYSDSPRTKYCDDHRDPKNRKE